MSANAELIREFYAAFGRRDHAAMARCYAPDAQFSDPVFTDLRGWQVGAMWRMLCERATDLTVVASDVAADEATGRAHWEADYTFTATGRHVHNVIDATFELRGGRILRHTDRFDLYAWSRQALGAKGLLLGWTPLVRNAVRAQAARGLEAFARKHGLGNGG